MEVQGVHLVPMREIEQGAYYDGEISNKTDKREGFGAQVWKTGALYVGEWKDDRQHGRGRLIYEDGEYYEGDFFNDKANGKGEYHYNDGTVYKGDFSNNRP